MGSTGSIGRQTLDVAAAYPALFRIEALTANSNWELLARQALQFKPRTAVIADPTHYQSLLDALQGTGIEVKAGAEALVEVAEAPHTDIVVGALVGYSGLESVIAALEAGKTVALANKETLVVAGGIIKEIVARKGKKILPVDSEHSAIFQCLLGEEHSNISRILLTASGGPFRTLSASQLRDVTVDQALRHPNWDMGTKVTIDSATMMNKGFEMIEARWLFDVSPKKIKVLVHPESIIHSMVEFIDGSVKAQLGMPDMHLPIEVALACPGRLDMIKSGISAPLDLAAIGSLHFMEPDTQKFPLLELAYRVAEVPGPLAAVMNAANEVAVKAFTEGRIRFTDISSMVVDAVEKSAPEYSNMPLTLQSIRQAHNEGMKIARNFLKSL